MGNATGIAGMFFGIIACLFSLFPLLSLISVILGVLALISSILGVKKNDKKVFGMVGIVFSIIAIAIGLYWIIIIIVYNYEFLFKNYMSLINLN